LLAAELIRCTSRETNICSFEWLAPRVSARSRLSDEANGIIAIVVHPVPVGLKVVESTLVLKNDRHGAVVGAIDGLHGIFEALDRQIPLAWVGIARQVDSGIRNRRAVENRGIACHSKKNSVSRWRLLNQCGSGLKPDINTYG
jgi:hypothetical protein